MVIDDASTNQNFLIHHYKVDEDKEVATLFKQLIKINFTLFTIFILKYQSFGIIVPKIQVFLLAN